VDKKKCLHCCEEKTVDDFYKGSRRCKNCFRIKRKKEYDPEKQAIKLKKYIEKDPEKYRELKKTYTKKYELKNLEKIREKGRLYQKKLREQKTYPVDYKKISESLRKYRLKYPERRIARYKFTSLMNRKLLDKPKFCEDCKEEKKLEGHHEDYSKPFDILWLCKQCHCKYDNRRRLVEIGKNN